ncbi:MAG: glycerophosphodiester phosphodiesterase family protein [Christensenellales bacterium]
MNNIKNSWLVKSPIAHRGLFDNRTIAENSLTAFSECVKNGTPIELDVRITKDKQIIVFHDDKLGRMTDIDGYANNLDYADIKKAKLLKTTDGVPLLSDVLKLVDGKVPILIEIKNINGISYEKELWSVLSKYNGEYAIQSFSPLILEWFKLNAPQIKRGMLASSFKGEKSLTLIQRLLLGKLKLYKRAEPNFISYRLKDLPNRHVKNVSKKLDIPVIAWTVCSEDDKQRAKQVADNYIFQNVN